MVSMGLPVGRGIAERRTGPRERDHWKDDCPVGPEYTRPSMPTSVCFSSSRSIHCLGGFCLLSWLEGSRLRLDLSPQVQVLATFPVPRSPSLFFLLFLPVFITGSPAGVSSGGEMCLACGFDPQGQCWASFWKASTPPCEWFYQKPVLRGPFPRANSPAAGPTELGRRL